MDWATLGILSGLVVTGFGYLSHQIHCEVNGVRGEVRELRDASIRHLEHHAAH